VCAPALEDRRTVTITLATAVGLAGTLLAFAYTVPQLSKLIRLRSAAGVSVAALANSTISGIAWTAYGVIEGELWVALPAFVALPATAGALVLAWFRGGERTRLWLPVAWLATIVAATAAVPVLGPVPITMLLGLSVSLMITPAAITAWRSHDVSAIAASAWVMLIVDALVAGAYGVLAGVDANVLYAAVAVTGSVVILVRVGMPAHVHARLVPLSAPEQALVRDDLSLVA
jgi:uncharacterized protein with PQ loop repeat